MTRLRVAIDIAASPRKVWSQLEDVASHVEWMDDAVAIRFTSSQRRGVGTTFVCDTKVGPLSLADQMEVTEWQPGKAMAIRHVGLVTGQGRFELRRRRAGRATRMVWSEKLQFPWWMAGPIGGVFAKPILRRIWRRDLDNLKRIVESR